LPFSGELIGRHLSVRSGTRLFKRFQVEDVFDGLHFFTDRDRGRHR